MAASVSTAPHTPLIMAAQSEAARDAIRTQVTALNELHNRMVAACWSKCVPRPREVDMTIGEMACLDRCVAKYLETQAMVRAELEAARGGKAVRYP